MYKFTDYVINYQPLPWEVDVNATQLDMRGKTSVVINYARYCKVVNFIKNEIDSNKNVAIVDFGAFPGTWAKISREFFQSRGTYYAVGLGLSDDFNLAMSNLGVTTVEYELDPDFKYSHTTSILEIKGCDLCLFLDTIEHLTSPINALDQINKSLKLGGKIVITTDNISAFGYVMHSLLSGASPNIHPLRSNLFYKGPWRPHVREFSKEELFFFLEYSGFKVARHEYFERMQGDFFIDKPSGKLKRKSRYVSFTGLLKKFLCYILPHLRDHQILIAEKVEEHSDLLLNRVKPTESLDEWMELRAKYGL